MGAAMSGAISGSVVRLTELNARMDELRHSMRLGNEHDVGVHAQQARRLAAKLIDELKMVEHCVNYPTK